MTTDYQFLRTVYIYRQLISLLSQGVYLPLVNSSLDGYDRRGTLRFFSSAGRVTGIPSRPGTGLHSLLTYLSSPFDTRRVGFLTPSNLSPIPGYRSYTTPIGTTSGSLCTFLILTYGHLVFHVAGGTNREKVCVVPSSLSTDPPPSFSHN